MSDTMKQLPDPQVLWTVSTISAAMVGSGMPDGHHFYWPVALDDRLLRPVLLDLTSEPLKVIIDGHVLIEFDSDTLVMKCIKLAALCEVNSAMQIEVELRAPAKERQILRDRINTAVAGYKAKAKGVPF